MEIANMKEMVERTYKIQMAAIRVNEANEVFLAAQEAQRAQPYDWAHKDQEGNNRWVQLTDEMYRKEGLVKRAVNKFFKEVGRTDLVKEYDLGFSAILAFNKYIEDCTRWGAINPIPQLSLYACKARKY